MQRRQFLLSLAAASLLSPQKRGRLKQSVMRFNFPADTLFEEMCRVASRLGFDGFDLTGPQDWPILRQYALTC